MDPLIRKVVTALHTPGRLIPHLNEPLAAAEVGWADPDENRAYVRLGKLMQALNLRTDPKDRIEFVSLLEASDLLILPVANTKGQRRRTHRMAIGGETKQSVVALHLHVPMPLGDKAMAAYSRLWANWPVNEDGVFVQMRAVDIVHLVESLQITWLQQRYGGKKATTALTRARAMGLWLTKVQGLVLAGYTLEVIPGTAGLANNYLPKLAINGTAPTPNPKAPKDEETMPTTANSNNGAEQVLRHKHTPWPAGATNGDVPSKVRKGRLTPYWSRLGFVEDAEMAKEAGGTPGNVRTFRNRWGIPAWWKGETEVSGGSLNKATQAKAAVPKPKPKVAAAPAVPPAPPIEWAEPEWAADDPRYGALRKHYAGQKHGDAVADLQAEVAQIAAPVDTPTPVQASKATSSPGIEIRIDAEWILNQLRNEGWPIPEDATLTVDTNSRQMVVRCG